MAPYNETLNNKTKENSTTEETIVHDICDTHLKLPSEIGTDYNFKRKIVWFNVIGFLILHLAALYGYILCIFSANFYTTVWMWILTITAGLGVTMGAHRLYTHRSYKATWHLRLFLTVFQTVAGQNCMYIWVRDHRQHHKYSDTDADPHNANRGFFFSHIGWLMSRKHPAVISKGKTIDLSDLEADSIVMIQKRFYKPLYVVFAIMIPTIIPVYFWNETYINSFFISYLGRYILQLNGTWLVNSAAHLYGTRPYDETIKPVESKLVGFISYGEGWHNYHHAYPWDYRAAELGSPYNLTTFFINCFAALGLVYDLKIAPYNMVEYRALRHGDGTHALFGTQAQKRYGKLAPPKETLKSKAESVQNDLKIELLERKESQMNKRPVTVRG